MTKNTNIPTQGEKLSQSRIASGLTAKFIAGKLSITNSTVCKWEHDINQIPNLDLANWADMTLADVTSLQDNKADIEYIDIQTLPESVLEIIEILQQKPRAFQKQFYKTLKTIIFVTTPTKNIPRPHDLKCLSEWILKAITILLLTTPKYQNEVCEFLKGAPTKEYLPKANKKEPKHD